MALEQYQKKIQKIYRDDGGVAAIEFGLLAPVFFLLLFGIIEVAIVFFADMTLQNATLEAARLVRTGAVTGKVDPAVTVTEAQFVDKICTKAFILSSCPTKLKYQVRVLTDYDTQASGIVLTNYAGLSSMQNQYNVGGAEDIVLVRVYYEWDMFTGFIRDVFSTPGSNVRVIGGGVVFRNEPF